MTQWLHMLYIPTQEDPCVEELQPVPGAYVPVIKMKVCVSLCIHIMCHVLSIIAHCKRLLVPSLTSLSLGYVPSHPSPLAPLPPHNPHTSHPSHHLSIATFPLICSTPD